jgi:hypothetical protein
MSRLQKNYQVIVETYPDIARKIKFFWGNREFTDLMHELLNDTRDHSRLGFPKNVVASFLTLQALHDLTFPALSEKSYGARALSHRPSAFGEL